MNRNVNVKVTGKGNWSMGVNVRANAIVHLI